MPRRFIHLVAVALSLLWACSDDNGGGTKTDKGLADRSTCQGDAATVGSVTGTVKGPTNASLCVSGDAAKDCIGYFMVAAWDVLIPTKGKSPLSVYSKPNVDLSSNTKSVTYELTGVPAGKEVWIYAFVAENNQLPEGPVADDLSDYGVVPLVTVTPKACSSVAASDKILNSRWPAER